MKTNQNRPRRQLLSPNNRFGDYLNRFPIRDAYLKARLKRCVLLLFLVLSAACSERRQLNLLKDADEKILRGEYPQATEALRSAIALNPENKHAVKAIYKLGFTLESYLKDFDGALSNYETFIRLSEDRVSIYEVLKRMANIYFERDPDKAIVSYKKLISYNSDSLENDLFQFRIAQSYFRINSFEQARFEYQRLLERYPKSSYCGRARFEIGNTYYMEGKYDIALEALKQVLRHHSQSEYAVEAQFLMAECLEHQEKWANALQMYETLKDRYPASEVLELHLNSLKKRAEKTANKEKTSKADRMGVGGGD